MTLGAFAQAPVRWAAITSATVASGVAAAIASPPVVGGGVLVVALTAAAVYAPGVVLGLYLVVPPFFKAALQPLVPIDLTLILAAFCAPQIVLAMVSGLSIRGAALGAWIALAALIAAGTTWAAVSTTDLAVTWLALSFLPLMAAFRLDQRQLAYLVATLGIASGIVAAGGILSLASDRLVVFGASIISSGQASLIVPLLLAAGVVTRARQRILLPLALVTPVALVVALASGSRGPVVMALATGVIMLAVARVHLRPRGMALVIGIATAFTAAIASGVIPDVSLGRFTTLFALLADFSTLGSIETETASRASLYSLATDQFASRPLLGIGTGGFGALTGTYPHNVALQFGAEFGVVGLAAFASMLWVAFRGVGRQPVYLAVTVLAVFFVLNALVSSGLYENRMMWGLLLVLGATPRFNTATVRSDAS